MTAANPAVKLTWQRLFADGVRLCASESGACEAVARRTKPARVCVEQLAGLSQAAGATSALAACGSVVGRTVYSKRQGCGAGGIGEPSGSAAGAGGRRGNEENPSRLVSGWRDVPAGIGGAGAQADGRQPRGKIER